MTSTSPPTSSEQTKQAENKRNEPELSLLKQTEQETKKVVLNPVQFISQLSTHIQQLKSPNLEDQLSATQTFRKILAIGTYLHEINLNFR